METPTKSTACSDSTLVVSKRRRKRELQIEAWHRDCGFRPELFDDMEAILVALEGSPEAYVRNRARAFAFHLSCLRKVYQRTGWIGTPVRWALWTRILAFVRLVQTAVPSTCSIPETYGT